MRTEKERAYRRQYKKIQKARDKKNGKLQRRRAEYQKRYRAKYSIKNNAYCKVNRAVRSGRLKKAELCSICGQKGLIMGHHHDYMKPLDVIWVCMECHLKIHKTD
jgi:cytidylate kinase